MGEIVDFRKSRFAIGEVVNHELFGYRGVIVDVDPVFQASDAWYESVARSRPPKDKPWYHVLVDGASHMTYVAERNLSRDSSGEKIKHPLIDQFFSGFENGRYVLGDRKAN